VVAGVRRVRERPTPRLPPRASSLSPLGPYLHLWGHVALAVVCDKGRHEAH
jgi:hypothetical protein